MSRAEWLRTFVAVYRAGSVTAGARVRGISQPAASQQLASLSKAAGAAVLARSTDGVSPTPRGRELYAEVAESLDRLETVLAGLDGGRLPAAALPLRIGCSAELLEGYLLPRITDWPSPLTAMFGTDRELFTWLAAGEADLVLTPNPPGRRTAFETSIVGERRYVLVSATEQASPEVLRTLEEVAGWLSGRPWISYSHELPVTRRFWSTHLGRPFDADVRLVASDLRAVATAVELGMGASLLPDFACHRQIATGSVTEIYDVSDLVAAEPIYSSTRGADAAHPNLRSLLESLRR
ncbi:MAG TPA: LysR family transcriptional regulator [Propionibacteriaceae bacterium]|jgi:DNA-binding transcriptional LysR family regulator